MTAKQITDNVYFVGAADYNCRSFHGYHTPGGVTYNAYLITGEKNVLIDSVKAPFTDEMLERIESVLPVGKIDYIVCNHAENDHSGAIAKAAQLSGAQVYCTVACAKLLEKMYGITGCKTVKAGDTLGCGDYTLSFMPTPFVHWPDNMVTFCEKGGKKILFSNDAFGQHLCTNERFDTAVGAAAALKEAKTYFANIVLPYSKQAANALDAVIAANPDVIAPSHGIVWTTHIPDIYDLYKKLCGDYKQELALVIYDTMWGGTQKQALQIGANLEQSYSTVKYFNLSASHLSDVMDEMCFAKHIAVGSPTLNGTIMPNVAALLCYMKGLKPRGLTFEVFGTKGWAGGAEKEIAESLTEIGCIQKG